MDIFTIFVTGLFAGGLTCLAVQGGLLASSVAQQKQEELENKVRFGEFFPVLSFLTTRLVAYTIVGFLLGSLGSVLSLSIQTRVILQFLIAVFMIGTAFNLLQVHPIFRYFVIQPPKFLTRMIKSESRSSSLFAPGILGALTVLIPCGATQAMMAYAIATGSSIQGALTMFVFILGTSPLFFLIGLVTKRLSGSASINFNRISALAIIGVALFNLNGAINLGDFGQTAKASVDKNAETVKEATIVFGPYGYTTEPAVINVKAGEKVSLNLVNNDGTGCVQAFTIPSMGIQKIVSVGSKQKITLTAPLYSGKLNFMCSMGMYRGSINVI